MIKVPSWCLRVLIIFALCCVTTPSSADLGLSSSDFGSKPVSGNQVNGPGGTSTPGNTNTSQSSSTPTYYTSQTTQSNDLPSSTSEGDTGAESAICQLGGEKNQNNSSEGSTCDGNCVKSSSYVNLFTRQYQDDSVDMLLKVAGGYLKVHRIYTENRWHFEHEVDRLDLSSLAEGLIKKSYLSYKKGEDGLFHYKTFVLADTGDHYRWENKSGDFILYSKQGLVLESGSRIGTLARYHYDGEKLLTINDRDDSPIYYFEYNQQGKVSRVHDNHKRQVTYNWEGNNLLKVTDILGHATTYQYSPEKNQLVAKSDEAGRKFLITYHPDGAVASVLSRTGGGYGYAFETKERNTIYYA